jgi:Tol biopolymer transport system component
LAFVGGGSHPPGGIYVVNADGSKLRRLPHKGFNFTPAWSPDGSRIAFVRYVPKSVFGFQSELYTMASDGTDMPRPLHVIGGSIAWNPVG